MIRSAMLGLAVASLGACPAPAPGRPIPETTPPVAFYLKVHNY
jgi:hypothetical protein